MSGAENNSAWRGATWLLALLSTGILEIGRAPHVDRPWLTFLDAALVAAVSAGAGRRFRRAARSHRAAGWWALAFVLLISAWPLLIEPLLRRAFGAGQSPELVQFSALRNFMWALAALSHWPGMAKLSCLLSLFLAVGSIALISSPLGYAVAVAYGMVGMWWLMGANWERMRGRFAAESRSEIPLGIGTGSILAALGLAALAALLVGGVSPVLSVSGWFWGSGGDQGRDAFARQGVGDGDAVVASFDNPQTFGPVDDGLMLESHMPSLYDVFNDMYGETVKKQFERQKTVALSGQQLQKDSHELPRTQDAGRQFSTLRKRAERSRKELAGIDSPALIFLQGRVPLHLRLETFDQFEHGVWRHGDVPVKAPSSLARLRMTDVHQKPWLVIEPATGKLPAGDAEPHVIKFINLQSARVPTPAGLVGAHVDQLNRADFYRWTADDVLQMDGWDRVPPLTVIHLRSQSVGS